jgi:putative membrane protein
MKIILILVFLAITLVALVFSLLNFQPVEINLYFTSISMPLALALTIELFVGISIGLLAAFYQIIKLKSQYAKLNKKQTNKT